MIKKLQLTKGSEEQEPERRMKLFQPNEKYINRACKLLERKNE